MKNAQPGLNSLSSLSDRTTLLRSLGLILLGIGSLIIGAQILDLNSILAYVAGIEGGINSETFIAILFVAVLIAGIGVVAGGIGGIAAFALGNSLLGSLFLFGDINGIVSTLGFVSVMLGFSLRLFNQD